MQLAAPASFSESATLGRVDRVIGRAMSIFAFSSVYECWPTFFNQLPHLNHNFAIFNFVLLLAALLYNAFNFWLLGGRLVGYLIVAGVVLFNTLSWPLQLLPNQVLDPHFKPWVWWITGLGPLAIGMFISKWWAWVYCAVMPVAWFIITLQPGGGSTNLKDGFISALFVILFPATLVALGQLLRQSASRVDDAAKLATEAVVEAAKVDAVEREAAKVAGELHDSVLSALSLVSEASSTEAWADARTAAAVSIVELKHSSQTKESSAISVASLTETLQKSIDRTYPWLKVEASVNSLKQIDSDVVEVLIDATMQAISNSIQHAGARAHRRVKIRVNDRAVKIVVNDDGVGFRIGRVSRDSVGLRWGIINRVKAVGGEVFIDTKPGAGTSIIIQYGFTK